MDNFICDDAHLIINTLRPGKLPIEFDIASLKMTRTGEGKPLRFELEGRWVARRGPYRIIYSLDEEERTVRVLAVAPRADAYRTR